MPDVFSHLGALLPDRRADLDRLRPRFPDGDSLAAELARRGWLTPFQRRWLARGHGRRLLVGPYVLLDRVGRGGMGQVFLAEHRHLRRRAALKVVRPDRADRPEMTARFVREVRSLGRLNHENVVHAYDAGAWGRGWYLAMEYVPGPDLRQLLDGGPLPTGLACEYARQAALGLQHVHDRGLVHRDVKPANLSLSAGGRVLKVLDAGLVRERVRRDDGLTRAGVFVGTPDYAAPEQVTDSRTAGRRADQYGLGCTLYHLLTGRVPFPDGPPVARAVARVTKAPRPVDEVRRGLPGGLGAVVGRLLSRRPQDRFPNMGAAAGALARFAAPVSGGASETAVDLPTAPRVANGAATKL